MRIYDIQPFDIFEVPPLNWWEEAACKAQGSRGFHMGLCVDCCYDKTGRIEDWTTSESISKGLSLDRLFHPNNAVLQQYRGSVQHYYIYRIKAAGDVDPRDIYRLHSLYGKLPYGYLQNLNTAAWWLAWYYLHKPLPVFHTKGINCVSWVALAASKRGYQLVPENQYAIEVTIEQSPMVEFLGMV